LQNNINLSFIFGKLLFQNLVTASLTKIESNRPDDSILHPRSKSADNNLQQIERLCSSLSFMPLKFEIAVIILD